MQIPEHLRSIPGYVEAVKHENDIRNAAILNLNTRICGIEIRQMTLRHWIILDGIDSPLLCSNYVPSPEDVIKFLWILSPKFAPDSDWKRWVFFRRCKRIPYGEAVFRLRKYIEDTFQDSPPSQGGQDWDAPQFSFAVGLIYSLAEKFHWPREKILDLPLKEIFQYKKIIRMSTQDTGSGAACQRNPSDLIYIKHVRKVRAERAAAKASKEQQN